MNSRSGHTPTVARQILIVMWLALSLLLWLRDRSIIGPFIFYDEALYFNLGRTIFTEGHYAGHTSYNPLYPLAIAPLFALPSAIHTYEAIRILNCLLWSSVVFPVYLVSRRFVENQNLSYLVAMAGVLAPLSAVVSIVWAEPLFYPLYAFCVLLFVRLLETQSRRWAVALGVACGLLFMTKQAGLALMVSILLGLLVHYLWWTRCDGRFFRRIVLYAATVVMASAPWLIRNRMTPGAGVLGYAHWTQLMTETVLSSRMLGAIGYNLSYVVIALYSVYLIYYIAGFSWESKNPVYATFVVFTVSLFIVVLFCASLISTVVPEYAKYPSFYPVGRYLSLVFPYIFIVATVGAQRATNLLRERLTTSVLICGACCITLFYWSPLKAVGAKSFIDNPSLSVLAYLFDDPKISLWAMPRLASVFERACVALAPCAVLLTFLLFRRSWQPVVALLIVMTGSSLVAARFVYLISVVQRDNNALAKELVSHGVDISEVVFDPALNPEVSPYLFWFKNGTLSLTLKTAPPSDFRFPAVFDFATKDSPIAFGAIPVQAPWVGASLYNDDQGYGFDPANIDHLFSYGSPGAKIPSDGLNDYVYGSQPSRFRIKTGNGQFRLTFWVPRAGRQTPIDFGWEINGEKGRVSKVEAERGRHIVLEHVSAANGFVDVIFHPKAGSNWAVSKLTVESRRGSSEAGGARYYATLHKLQLPLRLKAGQISLYRLP